MFNLSVLHVWFKTFGWNHPVCSICQYFMSSSKRSDGITLYVQTCQYFMCGSKLLDGITLYIQLVCSSCVVQNFWMESPCIFNLSVLHVWFKIWMESPCTDPSKCINDQTLRSDREFCRTLHRQMSDQIVRQMSDQIVRQMSDQILPGWSESLHSQIVKL